MNDHHHAKNLENANLVFLQHTQHKKKKKRKERKKKRTHRRRRKRTRAAVADQDEFKRWDFGSSIRSHDDDDDDYNKVFLFGFLLCGWCVSPSFFLPFFCSLSQREIEQFRVFNHLVSQPSTTT